MSITIRIRQTIEFDVEVDDFHDSRVKDFDYDLNNGRVDPFYENIDGDITVINTEVLERKRTPNYLFDCDYDKELFYLKEDGKVVFADRDHNEIVREYGRRAGVEVTFVSSYGAQHNRNGNAFLDYGDPDEAWDTLKGRNKK